MKFCPKCGSIMFPKKTKGKTVFVCKKCGYEEEIKDKVTVKEEVKDDNEIFVVNEDEELKSYPKVKAICPRCKNDEAYFQLIQTRAGDEAPTKFYKCTKCGYVWREYE